MEVYFIEQNIKFRQNELHAHVKWTICAFFIPAKNVRAVCSVMKFLTIRY